MARTLAIKTGRRWYALHVENYMILVAAKPDGYLIHPGGPEGCQAAAKDAIMFGRAVYPTLRALREDYPEAERRKDLDKD